MGMKQGAKTALAFGVAVLAGAGLGMGVFALIGLPEQPHVAVLVTGGIAAAIALLAVTMSYFTIRAGRHNAKATVTFQHIARTQADGDMIKARALMKVAEKEGSVSRYAAADKQTDPTAAAVNLILNDLEIVSIGIQRGIIDCSLFRAWCERATVDNGAIGSRMSWN